MKPYFKIRNYCGNDGLNQIALYYSHKGDQLYIDTTVKTKPIYFNGNGVIAKCIDIKQNANELNNLLRTCMNKVEKIILDHKLKYGLDPTTDFLSIEYFKAAEIMERDQSVITVFNDWIKEKKKKIKNIKLYKTIYNDLEHLYPSNKLYFRMIDKHFLKKLLDYWLYDLKIQNSTINKRLVCLKQFLNQMYVDKANEFSYYKDFKSDVSNLNTSSNIVILTQTEFQKFLEHKFERKALSYVRDIYAISSVTGLRFSDVIRLSPDNFYTDKKGDWIISDVTKTEQLQLKIPLTGIANRILQSYNFQLRKISNQKCNVYLEDALKECKFNSVVTTYSKIGTKVTPTKQPKYKAVNFHSSRKFFVTTCLASNVPIPSVMQWTGQSSQTISKYIGKGEADMDSMLNLFK